TPWTLTRKITQEDGRKGNARSGLGDHLQGGPAGRSQRIVRSDRDRTESAKCLQAPLILDVPSRLGNGSENADDRAVDISEGADGEAEVRLLGIAAPFDDQ